jgi:dUTP pyrophosphatase
MDLPAAIQGELELLPGQRLAVPTGFKMAVPAGFEAQIRPRSGLALKHGLTVINAPGTIDSDYRGEVKVLLANLSSDAFTIRRGDRIAQLVMAPVVRIHWSEGAQLPETQRGAGGFGHTGT